MIYKHAKSIEFYKYFSIEKIFFNVYYTSMKVVILAGGFGTRISEETISIPKPMIEIGGRPILWHIMKIYSHYGFKDFIIALGYKSDYIKNFFLDAINFSGDINIEFKNGSKKVLCNKTDDINLQLIDTGINTNTGGRLKFLRNYLDLFLPF